MAPSIKWVLTNLKLLKLLGEILLYIKRVWFNKFFLSISGKRDQDS